MIKRLAVVVLCGAMAALLGAALLWPRPAFASPPPRWRVVLEATPQANVLAVYLAEAKGYFAAEGIAVEVRSHPTGREALDAMLAADGSYAVCADTPFIRAWNGGADVRALASLGDMPSFISFVGRRDRGIRDLAGLAGRRIGMAAGTNSAYAVEAALRSAGLPATAAVLVDLSAAEMRRALLAGEIDLAALWEPHSGTILGEHADAVADIEAERIYRAMWIVAADVADRPDGDRDRAVLRALMRATADLAEDPIGQAALVAARMGQSVAELQRGAARCRFRLTLDHALLLNLEAQQRWLAGIDGSARRSALDALAPDALAAIDPQAVTILHPDLAGP